MADNPDGYRARRAAASSAIALIAGVVVTTALAAGAAPPRVTVHAARTPRANAGQCLVSSGAYPVVRAVGLDVRRVNLVIRTLVVKRAHDLTNGPCPSAMSIKSTFRTTFAPRLLSATDLAISALIPTIELAQNGNDGETWISVTVLVKSGKTVGFAHVIGSASKIVSAMTALIRREATRQSLCVRNALKDPTLGSAYAAGFARIQTADYALTSRGLAIGFANGLVTGPACGRIEVLIPYRLAEPYLSKLGGQLVARVLALK